MEAPRGPTHAERLYASETRVGRLTGCRHELGDRRAVPLVQLPSTRAPDDARLDSSPACCPGDCG